MQSKAAAHIFIPQPCLCRPLAGLLFLLPCGGPVKPPADDIRKAVNAAQGKKLLPQELYKRTHGVYCRRAAKLARNDERRIETGDKCKTVRYVVCQDNGLMWIRYTPNEVELKNFAVPLNLSPTCRRQNAHSSATEHSSTVGET